MPLSKHLGRRQIVAMEKIGDAMIPGEREFPSFSKLGCVRHVDRVLDFMPASDLVDLKTLLLVFSFLPRFLVGWILRGLEKSPSIPGEIGAVLRLIRIGLRGLIMTLYFGDPATARVIGYQVSVHSLD